MKLGIPLLATLLATATAYEAVSTPPCKEYETHVECGSACHPTCETFGDVVDVCTAQCIAGCFCKEGLLRTESGSCVPEQKCKKDACPV
ncbi:hypothetical protein BDW62DRAFT_184215 [Aspergillus aurantiobrunneus]